jgi:hypothetical protein
VFFPPCLTPKHKPTAPSDAPQALGHSPHIREVWQSMKVPRQTIPLLVILRKSNKNWGNRGSKVVKVLHYKSEGRWFDPRWCHWHKSFWSHYGPGVDSASNWNEYQEYFLGVNAAGAYGWQPYHYRVTLSRNLGTLTSWNTLDHSRPVMGLLYLIKIVHSVWPALMGEAGKESAYIL